MKNVSLVNKLMLLYTVSTITILAALAGFLYPTLNKLLNQLNGTPYTHIAIECYSTIILALLFSSLCAVVIGKVIASNVLKKIHDFESQMKIITVDSLNERIRIADWPKELHKLGMQFNMMLDRLQSSFMQLSQFSSDIAHELRTPINNLQGLTELAINNNTLSEESRAMLATCMNEYQHLSKLIENLLFLARSDHGQITINSVSINAHKEILSILELYQAMADDKTIELTCAGDAILPADLTLFRRVISNLLSNALRYTSNNGKITIEITQVNQDNVQIAVHDTGCGIASEHLPYLFDRFYRADASRATQSGELGLGLAIVKSIVELHRGKIDIKTKVNQGTSVYLYFPST